MNIVLVYPPFAPPTVMPYSLANLKGFLTSLGLSSSCLDLNAFFHKAKFKSYFDSLKSVSEQDYPLLLKQFEDIVRPVSVKNNKCVVAGDDPEFFQEILAMIFEKNPDLVCFSIVYSSQCFFAARLIASLSKKGIKTVVGGPAVSSILKSISSFLEDHLALVDFLSSKFDIKPSITLDFIPSPDFSDFDSDNYFSIHPIIPIKTSSACYYQRCSFCTHHKNLRYLEYPVSSIESSIKSALVLPNLSTSYKTHPKHFFLIDDMIHRSRLLELAKLFKPLNIIWWCQLKPTIDLKGIFPLLYDSGLRSISWGVESGCQKTLDAMQKGTNPDDISTVLKESTKAGIKNVVYIMFGFPGETKEDFLTTIEFLKENRSSIFMVSTSVFGLQEGSPVFDHPEKFNILSIAREKRSFLDDKLSYEVGKGISQSEAKRLLKRYKKTFDSLNNFPKVFKDYKEQILFLE